MRIINSPTNLGIRTLNRSIGPLAPYIQLSAVSLSENAVSGSTVGVLSVINGGGVYTFVETLDPDNKFVISGSNLNTNAALDYEAATSHTVTIRADGGTGSPITQQFTINVTNVFEAASLGALSLSSAEITHNQAATVNIIGATAGSVITGTVPDGLTLNSAARTISGTPTTLASNSLTLTETLADSANSPRATAALTLNVVEAPAVLPMSKVAADGDSIVVNAGSMYNNWKTNNPSVPFTVYAQSGAQIGVRGDSGNNTLHGRLATIAATAPSHYFAFILANDLSTGATAQQLIDRVEDFVEDFNAALPNAKLIWGTAIPNGVIAGANAKRQTINAYVRSTLLGAGIDAIIDFGAHPVTGVDGAEANALWFDGAQLHPQGLAVTNMRLQADAVMNSIRDQKTGTVHDPFTLTPVVNATAATTYTATHIVTSLGLGESAVVTVTGGQIKKNDGTLGTGSFSVSNGDVITVSNLSSTEPNTQVDAILTIGGTQATFSITTETDVQVVFQQGTALAIATGFVSADHVYSSVAFGAGYPLIVVDSDRTIAGLKVNGVAATLVTSDGNNRKMYLGSQLLTAGNHEVSVQPDTTNHYSHIITATLVDTNRTLSGNSIVANAFRNPGTYPTGASIPVTNGGLGIAWIRNGSDLASYTSDNMTLGTLHSNYDATTDNAGRDATWGTFETTQSPSVRLIDDGNICVLAASFEPAAVATIPELSAPTIALISAVGAAPQISFTWPSNVYAGYYLRTSRSPDGVKDVNGDYVTVSHTSRVQLQPNHLVDVAPADGVGDEPITQAEWAAAGYVSPTGLYYAQYRFEREDGVVSPWSNQITDTVVASVAQWHTTNGVNKNQYTTPTGYQTVGTNTLGAAAGVRADTATVGKGHLEFRIDEFSATQNGSMLVGLIDLATVLGPQVYNKYAGSNCPGICVWVQETNTNVRLYRNGGSAEIAMGSVPAVGDYWIFDYDTQAAPPTVKITHRRGTTNTVIFDSTLTAQVPADGYYAYVGPYHADKATVNFGQTAFQVTPLHGAGVIYG